MSELALLKTEGAIATLTINRPESRNALSIDLLAGLHARLDELDALLHNQGLNGPKVLMLTGEGKSFCAGMDLKQVLSDPAKPLVLLGELARLCLRLRGLPCVTVAAVNGAAIGGGCGLTTVCDFAVTFADNKMGFPEVDLGVCPAVVAPWLVRKVGAGRARMILLQGGLMSGTRAGELGIVTQVVQDVGEVMPSARALAERIASGGAGALRATKSLLNELDDSLNAEISARAARLSAEVLLTPETQAMLRAKLGN